MNKSTNSTTTQTNPASAALTPPTADGNAERASAAEQPRKPKHTFRKKLLRLLTDREYWFYTLLFLGILLAIFFFIMLSGVTNSPTFTYAEF